MSLLLSAAPVGHPAGRLLRWLLRSAVRLGAVVLLLAVSLSLLAWLIFHWGILPRLDDWRPRLAAAASQQLGVTVEIGRLEARSSAWVPAFSLSDVVLREPGGREALRLPKVSVALSVPSLLALRLRFAQLLIDGPQLDIRRDQRGHLLVAGIDLSAAAPGEDSSAAADWLFTQGEIVVRGGQLRWTDELRGAPPLVLDDLQLVLRNSRLRHALRLDATPPPGWGERFSLRVLARQPLLSRQGMVHAGDWRRWSGTLYAELPRVATAQLRHHLDLPVDLQQGQAALRAWLDWDRARPQALTLDAQLQDVRLRLAKPLAPLDLLNASVRLAARQRAGGAELTLSGLRFDTADGQAWAPSNLALQWQWTPGQAPTWPASAGPATGPASAPPSSAWPVASGSLRADRIDLAPLAALAERLPLGAGLRRLLAQLDPQGTVSALEADWQGPLDAPVHYTARAALRGVAIAAAPAPEPGGVGRPGWHGADLDLLASDAGGTAQLRMRGGQLSLPGIFEPPQVDFDQLSAQLKWRIERAPHADPASLPRIEVTAEDLRFANADVEGTLSARWHSGPGSGFGKGRRYPGVLALDGRIQRGQAKAVARYLPLQISPHTREWVQHAVLGGEVHDVAYRVKGDLWAFPFVSREEGDFHVVGQLRDVQLAPVPSVPALGESPAWISPWPAISNISGELEFERHAMRFKQASGRLWGLALSGVSGGIPALSGHAVLALQGQVRGPAADLLRYVNTTPIGGWIGQGLAQASATGPADLNLSLNLPLDHLVDSTLRAELQLAGNDVRLGPDLPLLANARGRVGITQRGVQLQAVRTDVLGGEALIDGGSLAEGGLRFNVAGSASAEGLRRTTEWPLLAQAGQVLQGQAPYKLQLGLVQGLPEILLTSGLQGMAINLPAPLAKAAASSLPLRVQTRLLPEPGGAAAKRDTVRASLGPLQLGLLREFGATDTRVLRSALAYDAPLPEPVAGGQALLKLPALDADLWRSWWATQAPAAVAGPGGGRGGSADAAAAPVLPWPAGVRLDTPEFKLAGRRLSGLSLELQRLTVAPDIGWRAQVQADQAQGSVELIEPLPGQAAGRVRARLARLVLPPADAEQVSGLLDQAPLNMPALDIEVNQFELRGKPLGRLQVLASNRPLMVEGTPRTEWRLNKLSLHNGESRFDADGLWRPAAGAAGRHVALAFKLAVDDGGKLLERLGFGRLLQGGQGSLQGTLGWDGSPLALDLPSLGGDFKLQMAKGRFLKVDPGAARLLGVLSLQALPRRLALDFRDLFQEGFVFDDINADLAVHQGVVRTDNLQMRGLQAAVFLAGSADIAHETQDLRALVLPELPTVSASLAYTLINPAAGLGALMAQWLLREPIRQASAREFHITGSWDDPQVARIARKMTDPLPAAANPGASPPAQAASVPVEGASRP